ncbi:MAG: phenylacetic acid degradation protein PaaN [Phycisphaerales bacterium]
MSHPLFDAHRQTLDAALDAIRSRTHHSAYPEVPSGKIYGETAKADGLAAFQARLGSQFELGQAGDGAASVGTEVSPFGIELNVRYAKPDLEAMVAAAQTAAAGWRDASREARAGVCLEILHRLNRRSFELAFSVMHTTGQGFMMAFQAGGPHAQDRGLEAVAYAWDELARTPERATWTKRVGRDETVTLEKTFRVVPRGIGLVIACSTFPTWNSYPAIFADLMTGNAVIIKPHPGAILPLAVTAEICRDVLAEHGFDPNTVQLAADTPDAPITTDLATRPEVGIIDYTGGNAFGEWLSENARHAALYTETAGVNSMILDSIDDLRAVTGNLAFTVSLYSGQMCTTSQNIFLPAAGLQVGGDHMSFDDVAAAIVKAVDWLLGEPARGAEILGAVQNPATAARVDEARTAGGTILRDATPVTNEHFPEARVISPLIVKVNADQRELFGRECFGPVVYIVATESTEQSIELAASIAREQGAITCGLHSNDADVIAAAEDATALAGVPLSVNLTGGIYVNQAAAFSDFHVSGANPSGNATLCDGNFVAGRFRVVQSRIPVPAAVPAGA